MLHNNDFYGEFVDGIIRTYLCIHGKCLIYLPDLSQILISSKDRYKSPQHHTLQKSVKVVAALGRTDRQDDADWRFS
jgi:hypothetical protein